MDKKIRIEICCGSAEDVHIAAACGADRAELSSCLYFGGLTPSVGTVVEAKKAGIPVIAMVRPREGGFCYSESEKKVCLLDAQSMLGAGADGIVFGGLTENGRIDLDFTRRMVELAEDRETVFHRAFDLIESDWKRSLSQLIDLGVTRVLTSGFAATAPQAVDTLAEMVRFAAGAIEILPGSGIRLDNAVDLCRRTGCDQIHTSGGQLRLLDPSEGFSEVVSFAPGLPPQPGYGRTNEESLRKLVREVKGL